MKLKHLILTAVSVLPLAAFSHNSHFYGGVQGGFTSSNTTVKISGTNGANSGSDTLEFSKSAVTGGILGGYHKTFDSCFLMGEISGRLGDVSEKKDNLQLNSTGAVPLYTNYSAEVQRKYTVGLSAKLGKFFNSNLGAFLSLGALNSQFRVNFSSLNTNQSNSQKKNLWGIAPGAGLIYNFGEKLVLRGDYSYEMYSKFNSKNLENTATRSLNFKLNPRYHTFLVSLSYMI